MCIYSTVCVAVGTVVSECFEVCVYRVGLWCDTLVICVTFGLCMSNSLPPQTHTVTRLSPGCLAAPLLVLGRWMEIHYVSLVEPLLFIAWQGWARSTPLCPSQDAGGLGC